MYTTSDFIILLKDIYLVVYWGMFIEEVLYGKIDNASYKWFPKLPYHEENMKMINLIKKNYHLFKNIW
jgi:hypothetical protein